MTRYSLIIALLASTALLSESAQAEGFYVQGFGGVVIDSDHDAVLTSDVAIGATLETDLGFGVGVAGGYELPMGLHFEAEVAFRANDITALTAPGVEVPPIDGSIEALSGMVNVIYGLDLGGAITPYLGIGFGIAQLNLELEGEGLGDTSAELEDTVFAFQGMAGVAYALTPSTSFGAEYRYFGTQDLEDLLPEDAGDFAVEYDNHSLFLTIRQSF